MSMISRQKLIEELEEELEETKREREAIRDNLFSAEEQIQRMAEKIESLKQELESLSQPPADQWIPCSEITVEQVVEAMKVIKSYCSQYKNCAGCRFEDWCWYDREHLTPDDWLMPEPYKGVE